jgi:hypothetical protein
MGIHKLHKQILRRKVALLALGLFVSLFATASVAHAHGGMAGPDDLGPPLFTSAALAFVCYWVVILWPRSKRRNSDEAPPGRKMSVSENRRLARQSRKTTAPRPTPQLRKVEGNRARRGAGAGRKASDI